MTRFFPPLAGFTDDPRLFHNFQHGLCTFPSLPCSLVPPSSLPRPPPPLPIPFTGSISLLPPSLPGCSLSSFFLLPSFCVPFFLPSHSFPPLTTPFLSLLPSSVLFLPPPLPSSFSFLPFFSSSFSSYPLLLFFLVRFSLFFFSLLSVFTLALLSPPLLP